MIEEVIRMMLEIINSCLCNSLHHNPNLVYALLYKRELFEQFRTHPSFQDIMQNLDTVSGLGPGPSPTSSILKLFEKVPLLNPVWSLKHSIADPGGKI